jgi:hypothetical protein
MNKEEIIVNPSEVITLIDGTRTKSVMPEYNDEMVFESVYSVESIIIRAKNRNEAIEKYKEIRSNLLID